MGRIPKPKEADFELAAQVMQMSPPVSAAWRMEGGCAASDPEAAFVDTARWTAERARLEKEYIERYCGKCSVRLQCLYTGVMAEPSGGIWGGETSAAIRKAAQARELIAKGEVPEELRHVIPLGLVDQPRPKPC